jgi:hypothetical protein
VHIEKREVFPRATNRETQTSDAGTSFLQDIRCDGILRDPEVHPLPRARDMPSLVYLGSQGLAMLLHPGMWFKAAKANFTAATTISKVGRVCFLEFEED